jgi:hypothetical protein
MCGLLLDEENVVFPEQIGAVGSRWQKSGAQTTGDHDCELALYRLRASRPPARRHASPRRPGKRGAWLPSQRRCFRTCASCCGAASLRVIPCSTAASGSWRLRASPGLISWTRAPSFPTDAPPKRLGFAWWQQDGTRCSETLCGSVMLDPVCPPIKLERRRLRFLPFNDASLPAPGGSGRTGPGKHADRTSRTRGRVGTGDAHCRGTSASPGGVPTLTLCEPRWPAHPRPPQRNAARSGSPLRWPPLRRLRQRWDWCREKTER